eukprot:CAMPEP_0196586894 /NCGR_PEP_ID=MMETSP1081-20130531/55876_1 /TAXON_ID=36882 /ORGANISM="Pyramimonas amylifera, Strain CCMP720" /LENGTH=186 /DNA_ID=CAMNT_0041908915 /DNA_START=182 /DNA_END=739 /DNA_ORIENTATION=+
MEPNAVSVSSSEKKTPVKGIMYAQIGVDSDTLKSSFRLSQKISLASNTNLKLFGLFTEQDPPRCRVQVTHKEYIPNSGLRINGRMRYEISKHLLKASVYVKKKVAINDTTNLNLKLEGVGRIFEGEKKDAFSPEFNGKVELSKTWLNVTSTQDCRMRIGTVLGSDKVYMQVRENHVVLECDNKGSW